MYNDFVFIDLSSRVNDIVGMLILIASGLTCSCLSFVAEILILRGAPLGYHPDGETNMKKRVLAWNKAKEVWE